MAQALHPDAQKDIGSKARLAAIALTNFQQTCRSYKANTPLFNNDAESAIAKLFQTEILADSGSLKGWETQ